MKGDIMSVTTQEDKQNDAKAGIRLGDILKFDDLRKHYPNKEIKLLFNKNWSWQDEDGSVHWFDHVQEYRDSKGQEDTAFYQHIFSLGDRRRKLQDYNIAFQFIEIGWHSWLLVDARVIIKADGCTHKYGWPYAQAERLYEYAPYLGRIIVDWTNKGQSWYYVDTDIVDNIPVDTVLKRAYLESIEAFTGFDNVCRTYKELKRIIDDSEWWTALSSVYGVYAITDRATGKQYVGSAYGDTGVAGRWSVYLHSGYDKDEKETGEYPNKKLKNLVNEKGLSYIQENFQYALLEIFPKTEIGKKKALERESYWKVVLQTREFGYNDN